MNYRQASLFRQGCLPPVKGNKNFCPKDNGGRHMNDIERAAPKHCRIKRGKFIALLFNGATK